jgi:hypothetical protein
MADYKEIVSKYKDIPGGLIEAYHALQKEYNYIPDMPNLYSSLVQLSTLHIFHQCL